MSWAAFETTSGGRVQVQPRCIVAIHGEQARVELATAAGGGHALKDIAVQRAARMATG